MKVFALRLLLGFGLLLICSVTQSQNDQLVIQGFIEGASKGAELYFWQTDGNVRLKVDTIQLQEGHFTYTYQLSATPNMVRISNNQNRSRITFWAENNTVKLAGSLAKLDEAEITGFAYDEAEKQFSSLYDRKLPIAEKLDLIEKHLDAPAAIHRLYQVYRAAPPERLRVIFTQVDKKWEKHDYAITIANYLALPQTTPLQTGDQALDFQAKNKTAETVQFSDNYGEGYILLEFKNHYCPYSRKAIQEIASIYQASGDNLKIISFSTDTRDFLWEAYLADDETPWEKWWDGQGEIGKICVSYAAQGSPYYFIIDSQGKIVDHWKNYSKGEIQQRVAKVLNASTD